MAAYSFVTRWFVDAPIERVFAALEDAPRWPSWWKGVVAVDIVHPGGADGVGMVTRTAWRGALGYGLLFDARVTKKAPPEHFEVESTGELVGRGRLQLTRDGGGTLVVYFWDVSTTKRWMNVLAPVLRPAFGWNHAVVMRWGGEGLGRLLGARFEDRSRDHRSAA